MADNVTFTTPSFTAAADEVTYSGDTSKVQLMRLVHVSGSEGSKTLTELVDSTTSQLIVQPAGRTRRISVTPTLDTSAYGSGDSLCGQMTIANAVRNSGGSAILQSITVLDRTQAQRAAMDILFFDRSVTVAAANAALAMSDADMANCLGVISIGPYNTAWAGTPANSISTLVNIGLPIVVNSGTDLYAAVCVRATPTYGSGDLTFSFTFLQD